MTFFGFFRPTQKIGREGPKWGREVLFPAKKNIADIFGRTDFDFGNLYFLDFFGSQISGLGPLGPRVGPPTWAPDAAGAGAGAAGQTPRSQPDPSPSSANETQGANRLQGALAATRSQPNRHTQTSNLFSVSTFTRSESSNKP